MAPRPLLVAFVASWLCSLAAARPQLFPLWVSNEGPSTPQPFSVGDFIEASGYFPIEVNVPDAAGSMFNYIMSRLPIINRWWNLPPPEDEFQNYSNKVLTPFEAQIIFVQDPMNIYP